MKKLALVFTLFALVCGTAFAQMVEQPIKWSSKVSHIEGNTYEVLLEGALEAHWHMYDFGPYVDGPIPAAITFETDGKANLLGKPYIKTEILRDYDEMFEMEIGYCENEIIFGQKIELTTDKESEILAIIEGQVCKEGMCMMVDEELSVALPAGKGKLAAVAPVSGSSESVVSAGDSGSVANAVAAPTGSLWSIILKAVMWGFVMLLTPCVFPMVPMTVSFFLKKNQSDGFSKARGRWMATAFGISIVALYTLPIAIIILVTYFAGGASVTADIFNWLATHWLPNILFFIIFMVFAASFFGAFEITMPSKWVNKTDSKSDKGGLGGIFFMALTLVLVSFSCTGPIVGSVLIEATQGGNIWEPIITMFAFSVAFALPFTVFAFAPSLLKNLPKSGGWLNSVKVVLGFIEVALGFKFLNIADMTYHWGLLDREVYLAIWIVVFSLLGLYLLGKIKFANDSPVEHVSVTRLTLAIIVFSFVVYMIPGMFGAPLKALSGYLPPMTTQDFVLTSGGTASAAVPENTVQVKYGDKLKMPLGIPGYFDYEEGLEAARKAGKPLFIDFSGHACTNCREMESRVWSDPQVLKMLKEDYVVLALYADDKMTVDKEDWITTDNGRVLKTLGKINSYISEKNYNVNAQPYYILLDAETGEYLAPGRGYNLDVAEFVEFLKTGLENYNK